MLRFDWDDFNIRHLARHGVSPQEAEEVILNDPIDEEFQSEADESRWVYVGETKMGRILRVVVTLREIRVRVITAFEPSRQDKATYLSIKAAEL